MGCDERHRPFIPAIATGSGGDTVCRREWFGRHGGGKGLRQGKSPERVVAGRQRLQSKAAQRNLGDGTVSAQRLGADALRSVVARRQRPKSFYVGSREFDPNKVGFVTTESPENSFLF